MDFYECCRRILNSTKTNDYAKAYARSGLSDLPRLYSGSELEEAKRVQCLYLLNNITHWRERGSLAVRLRLKELSKKPKSKK